MKLVDKMKDENLGLAILYNFTKGYGHVPMSVYDVVLPFLYHDGFRNHLFEGIEVRTYVKETIIKESVPKTIAVGTLTPPTYLRPISGGTLSSEFGYRWGSFHKGVDWYVTQGTTVTAAAAGTVTRAGWYGDYGYCVDITHSNGTMTRYGHLSSVKVSVGQSVSQGQAIAASGNTGYSTGPHLHFEIWVGGTVVNPLNYVNKN